MPIEGVESQRSKEISPSEIRATLMDKFQTNLNVLSPKIIENRSKEDSPRKRPLVTVVLSLWEEDQSLITSKMFSQSLLNLRTQAAISGMDLDLLIIANNGGGKTEELGNKVVVNLDGLLSSSFGEDNYYRIDTIPPDQANDPAVPWKANIPLSAIRTEGNDRCFLVVQPLNKLNEGKIRALRDASHSLYDEILAGYTPDAIFQMDAETILEYKPTHLTLTKQPFRAMYDALKRRDGVVAIGTKDRLEVMDPETGKPLGVIRPIAQEGMTQINTGKRENFISLPGGALLAEPDYYIAGMKAITEITYGGITEDYMLTQMLRAYGKSRNISNITRVNSLNVITHLNRAPQGSAAIEQLLRWKEQGNAVDQIFPEFKYKYKPLYEYIIKLAKSRLRTSGGSKRRFLTQSIKDARSIPGMIRLVRTQKIRDPLSSESTWGHTGKK